ncbi:hypothetical protein [uncultured Sphingomonas sp.]|uniref:hypothetical protein n=1 Tax=uncultured Sphingomonas sp. TaxID=158754 RepID=UPI0025E3F536|nr:hypothetical protein [uncultured Sphingomonas sp.]
MGFSISWVGVRGADKAWLLDTLGFADTGTLDEANEAPFSIAALPTGWTILFSNDFDFPQPTMLEHLSLKHDVIACQVEQHVMYSAASAFIAGVMQWSVAHDAQQGLRHLHTEGTPPITLETIRESLGRELENQPTDENLVDFLFDAPIELAAQTTGYRHDHCKFDWGQPHLRNWPPPHWLSQREVSSPRSRNYCESDKAECAHGSRRANRRGN